MGCRWERGTGSTCTIRESGNSMGWGCAHRYEEVLEEKQLSMGTTTRVASGDRGTLGNLTKIHATQC